MRNLAPDGARKLSKAFRFAQRALKMPLLRSFAVNSDGRSYKDLAPPEQFSLTLNADTPTLSGSA